MKYGKKHSKREEWEIQIVGLGIWQEKWKNMENEKHTLSDMEYVEKHWKTWKMKHKHYMTWNVARKTEKVGKW